MYILSSPIHSVKMARSGGLHRNAYRLSLYACLEDRGSLVVMGASKNAEIAFGGAL
jgi:hypothetical protein